MINKNNRIFIYISYISNYFMDHILEYIYSFFDKNQNHIKHSEQESESESDPEPININTQNHVDDYLKTKGIIPLKIDLAIIESMNKISTTKTTNNKKEKTKNKKSIILKLEM
jgi:hypothetical protein